MDRSGVRGFKILRDDTHAVLAWTSPRLFRTQSIPQTGSCWSVRHARGLASFYKGFEGVLNRLHPLFSRIGYQRLERPVAAVERQVKGLLFDCKMCGR